MDLTDVLESIMDECKVQMNYSYLKLNSCNITPCFIARTHTKQILHHLQQTCTKTSKTDRSVIEDRLILSDKNMSQINILYS